jgi:hypothetical protein
VGSWMIAWYAGTPIAARHSGSAAIINAAISVGVRLACPLTSPWRRANAFPDSMAVTFHLSSSDIGILILFSRKRSLTALQWHWHRIACSQQRSYAHLRWICSDADSQPNKILQPIPKDISRCRELVRCTSRNPGEPLPISIRRPYSLSISSERRHPDFGSHR